MSRVYFIKNTAEISAANIADDNTHEVSRAMF